MLKHNVARGVRDLFPGYFAFVMATGILSIVFHQWNHDQWAWLLFRVAQAAYLLLWLLTAARLTWFFPRFRADFGDHARAPGFFTIVAATSVLGTQYAVLARDSDTAILLWILGLVLWAVIMYAFFTAVMVGVSKPSLETGLNGTWLDPVVATQSISVLGTLIAPHLAEPWRERMLFCSLGMLLLGSVLYVLIITLIFYRFTFVRLSAEEFTPAYWIDMGAEAITTLAGATLIANASQWTFLNDLLPFLKGMTVLFWATGTWWIPLLLILGLWRHVYRHVPLRYDPRYWSAVFPVAMYAAATFALAQATGLDFLYVIPRVFLYVALLAWVAASFGMVRSLVGRLGCSSLGL